MTAVWQIAVGSGLGVVLGAVLTYLLTARNAAARTTSGQDAELQMLRGVMLNSQLLVHVKDLEGRYLLVNEPLQRSLGRSEEELLGQTADTFDDPELAHAARKSDVAARTGPLHHEAWFDAPGGRRYYDSAKFPLYDATGTVYAIGGVARDDTEHQRALLDLAEARDAAIAADLAKSTFLATMSHEIRTPMNAVIGMTDLLTDTELTELQQEFVETVRSSGIALIGIINDILDFAKIETGELGLESLPFNLRDHVDDCLDEVVAAATAKRIDLVCRVDDSCPEFVVGDVNRLRQILANLLSNAVKFTEHGEVVVELTADDADDRVQLTLKVRDTGIGIAADAMDRLFDPFSQVDASTTRAYGGSGLGLAITQRLAEAMSGRLSVRSVPGSGSTFTVVVLVDRCADRPAGSSLTRVAADPIGKAMPIVGDSEIHLRILLAEDNAVNQRVAQLMLAKLGHTVDTVGDGQQALAAAHASAYDVVIMDVQMPEMDGLEATRRIRAELSGEQQPHIIAMTASVLVEDRAACAAAGMDDYLTKPVREQALRAALAAVTTVDPSQQGDPDQVDIAGVPPVRRHIGSSGSAASEPVHITQETPAVDWSVLEALVQQLGSGPGVRDVLVSSYLDDGSVQVGRLLMAVSNGDLATVASVAHTLRSTSALFGANRLAELLLTAEDAARGGPGTLPAIARDIEVEHGRVMSALSSTSASKPVLR